MRIFSLHALEQYARNVQAISMPWNIAFTVFCWISVFCKGRYGAMSTWLFDMAQTFALMPMAIAAVEKKEMGKRKRLFVKVG